MATTTPTRGAAPRRPIMPGWFLFLAVAGGVAIAILLAVAFWPSSAPATATSSSAESVANPAAPAPIAEINSAPAAPPVASRNLSVAEAMALPQYKLAEMVFYTGTCTTPAMREARIGDGARNGVVQTFLLTSAKVLPDGTAVFQMEYRAHNPNKVRGGPELSGRATGTVYVPVPNPDVVFTVQLEEVAVVCH